MTIIREGFDEGPRITTTQQWSHYIAIAWGVIALAIVLNTRNTILNTNTTYTNNEAGIVATYPSGWLRDDTNPDYVFLVEDIQQVGYKTAFEVSLRPISPNTTARTIIDTLAMERSQTLAAYRILSTEPFSISQDPNAQQIIYTFVDTTTNPFLETIPSIVVGLDIVAISRGQAVIITLRSDADNFEINRRRFLNFVDQMEF